MNIPKTKFIRNEIIQKRILKITLNRPESLNAFNLQLISELIESLSFGNHHHEIDIIAITGAGRAFCAGGDLNDMDKKSDMFEGDVLKLRQLYRSGIQQIPRLIESINKPIIAMVNGAAVGAGCDLSCMCDIRLVSERAIFKESFVNLSLISGDGGSFFLQRVIGYAKSLELLLTGRKIKSDEALKIGLATEVFKEENFEKQCFEYMEQFLELPQEALRMSKLALKNSQTTTMDQHLEYVAGLQSILQRSQEHEDLVKKFLNSK